MGAATQAKKIKIAKHADWIDPQEYIEKKYFEDEDMRKMYSFFLVHCPCENTSSMSIGIRNYGWSDPWGAISAEKKDKQKSKKGSKKEKEIGVGILSKKLYKTMEKGFADGYAVNLEELEPKMIELGLLEKFPPEDLKTEIACYYQGKDNIWMGKFRHIRNCLAHSRFKIYEIENDYMFAFEDVLLPSSKSKSEKAELRARMLFKKSTIMRWISIIEAGEKGITSDNG